MRTSVSTTALTTFGADRSDHARDSPASDCPKIAEPSTNRSVSHSDHPKPGSESASVMLPVPTNCGFAAASPVSR